MGYERLLTNFERFRRHLSQSDSCPICPHLSEIIIHVLRDYVMARRVWLKLVPSDFTNIFFNCDLQQWLLLNLKNPPHKHLTNFLAVG